MAPLEFLFLADAYFTEKGIRDKVELRLVTPLSGAFTKPKASQILGEFLERKKIEVTPDFDLARVDSKEKKLVAWDDTEVGYDLLVSVPTNMGDQCIGRSGLGNELNYVPTDKETLLAKRVPDSGPEPPRSHAGYRMYPLSVVLRIRSIKSAQELGFSLKEIKELLSLAEDRTTDCADVRELARTKVAEICEKIQTLEAMKRALTVLAETCPGTGPAAKCSIEIKLLDMKQESIARRARELGVKRVPSVVIDGILVDCCAGRINEQTLRSAGIGSAF